MMRARVLAGVILANGAVVGCARTPYQCNATSDCVSGSSCTRDRQCAHRETTCADSGWAYNRSAGSPGVCVSAANAPAGSDGGDVATGDAMDAEDGALDVADVSDAVIVADAVDAVVTDTTDPRDSGDTGDTGDGASPCNAPRLIAPLSVSRITSNRPVFRWSISPGTVRAEIEMQRVASTTWTPTSVIAGLPYQPTMPIAAGVWFWRIRANCADGTSPVSPAWEVILPNRTAASPRTTTLPGPMDLDGDGSADFAIGTPGTGHVLVNYDANAMAPVTSDLSSDRSFGAVVANAGDLNGDGLTDLAIGSCPRLRDQSGRPCANFVHIAYGSRSRTLTLGTPFSAPTVADLDGRAFGSILAGVGDVNGDGYGDLAAGTADPGTTDPGSVLIFFGGPTGLQSATPTRVMPPRAGNRFGQSIAAIGDVDFDGDSDLAVGSEGHVDLFLGRALTLVALTGTTPSGLGIAVATAGDMSGDGVPDLAIGNRDALGSVEVFAGTTASPWFGPSLMRATGFAAGDGTGESIAGSGDADRDGFDDLAIGTERGGAGGDGTVRVYRGNTVPMLAGTLSMGLLVDQRFGRSIAFVGNAFNMSGTHDSGDGLLVGAPGISGPAEVPGQVWLYFWRASGMFRDAIFNPGGAPTAGFGYSVD